MVSLISGFKSSYVAARARKHRGATRRPVDAILGDASRIVTCTSGFLWAIVVLTEAPLPFCSLSHITSTR